MRTLWWRQITPHPESYYVRDYDTVYVKYIAILYQALKNAPCGAIFISFLLLVLMLPWAQVSCIHEPAQQRMCMPTMQKLP